MLELSVKGFAPITGAVTNAAPGQIDAEQLIDFDRWGETLEIELSALGNAAAFSVSAASLSLWASDSPASIVGATLLATVAFPLGGTAGDYIGEIASVTVANPGGQRYLVLTSTDGVG